MGELKITRKTNISLKPVILDEINLLRIKHVDAKFNFEKREF